MDDLDIIGKKTVLAIQERAKLVAQLSQLYQYPSVVEKIRTRHLQRSGHIQRMGDNVPKNVTSKAGHWKKERLKNTDRPSNI